MLVHKAMAGMRGPCFLMGADDEAYGMTKEPARTDKDGPRQTALLQRVPTGGAFFWML